jgi:hypothetical protein
MPEVNSSFMRDLKNLDSRLGVKFNGEHFVVTYKRAVGEVNLHRIEGDNGGYRQPDRRDLELLAMSDKARGDNPKVKLQKAAYAAECRRRERAEKMSGEIRDMTKDGKNQLRRSFEQACNLSKANSTFRRVPHKPGKNVVAVI